MNELNRRHFANGNGKNGLFLKAVLGVLIASSAAGAAGMVKMYRDIGVMQADVETSRRIGRLEELAANIARDRDQRTIIIQGFRDDIADLRRRLEIIERKGRS